jgi:endonuclease G
MFFFLFALLLFQPKPIVNSCDNVFYNKIPPTHLQTNYPLCKGTYFYIDYNSDLLCPDYTAYYLDYDDMTKLKGGRKNFMLDDELKSKKIPQASPSSKAFGDDYNRGHLVSSNLMSWNVDNYGSWYDTYMMSNICPQAGRFNQVEWKTLEIHILDWILQSKISLYAISGVIYNNKKSPTRRTDNIAQPDYFFTVLCDPVNEQSVGFYGNNTNTLTESTYIFRTVAEIENKIGIELFNGCNKNIVNPSHWWNWNFNIKN